MAKKLPWLRLYTETTKDPKIRRRPVAERWVWIGILILAAESPVRGTLLIDDGTAVTDRDIADEANVPLPTVRKCLGSFMDSGMISVDLDAGAWTVTKWAERQPVSDSNAADRQRKHRKLKAEGS